MVTNSKLLRVNIELAEEIEKGAMKNKMKITEYSKEIARILKQNKNKKIKRYMEIKF